MPEHDVHPVPSVLLLLVEEHHALLEVDESLVVVADDCPFRQEAVAQPPGTKLEADFQIGAIVVVGVGLVLPEVPVCVQRQIVVPAHPVPFQPRVCRKVGSCAEGRLVEDCISAVRQREAFRRLREA